MIKMLEELVEQLTGKPFKATEIPLDDPGVMQLFCGYRVSWDQAFGYREDVRWDVLESRNSVRIS